MPIVYKRLQPKISLVLWNGKDVLTVTFVIFFFGFIFCFFSIFLLSENRTSLNLVMLVGSLLGIFIPIIWIKKKYNLSKEALGLRRGTLNTINSFLIGIGAASIYVFLAKLTSLRSGFNTLNFELPFPIIHFIVYPISIDGFIPIILVAVSEEIIMRGFIYGYFRKKLGVFRGIFAQALFFGLIHYNVFQPYPFLLALDAFFIGLILGFLYEKTGSLYPSMICHGTLNYISTIFDILQYSKLS